MSPECTYWVTYQVRGLYLKGAKWFVSHVSSSKGFLASERDKECVFSLFVVYGGLVSTQRWTANETTTNLQANLFFSENRALFVQYEKQDGLLVFFFHCDIIMCVIIKLIEIWALTVFKGCWKHKHRHFIFHQHLWSIIISQNIRVSYEFLAAGFNMHHFCMR